MSSVTQQRMRARRWLTVIAATGALAAVPILIGARPVASAGQAPARLIQLALASESVAHQGLVQVDGRLGLPTLPVQSSGLTLLDRSSRIRSWWTSPDAWRTDVLRTGGQQQESATADGTRQWDYEQNVVIDRLETSKIRLPRPADTLPPAAARTFLAWIDSADRITALPSHRVAGLAADGVRIEVVDARSSIGRLDVWIDPQSGLPLQFEMYAKGSAVAAFSTRFLEVSLDPPDASLTNPVVSPTAERRESERRDLLSYVAATGNASVPLTLGGFPALTRVDLPAGIASYGTGFARMSLVQLPPRFGIRLIDSLTATPLTPGLGGQQVILGSALLQVAVLQPDSGGTFLLAGTLSPAAMKVAAADALKSLGKTR